MIEIFRQMLDVEPIDYVRAPEPQAALMGDECACADCTGGVAFLEGGDRDSGI